MDTLPLSLMDGLTDTTEATLSPFTLEKIQTFNQPWTEILDIHEFNSIIMNNSGVTTLDGKLEDNGTPADNTTCIGTIPSKLVACTMGKKRCGTNYLALVHKIFVHNGCHYMCPDDDCRNNIQKLYKSKQGLLSHVRNMHLGIFESIKSYILKEFYGKLSKSHKIHICI